uniref:Uncharacterized protein n=1 Tax=Eutreptiella gymnastica TaxID=73025 RepID=A0A7S4GHN5_9EUGL
MAQENSTTQRQPNSHHRETKPPVSCTPGASTARRPVSPARVRRGDDRFPTGLERVSDDAGHTPHARPPSLRSTGIALSPSGPRGCPSYSGVEGSEGMACFWKKAMGPGRCSCGTAKRSPPPPNCNA